MGKYRTGSVDLIDRIIALKRRIRALENNPRIVATAIDGGELIVPAEGQITIFKDDGSVGIVIAYYTTLGIAVIRFVPQGNADPEIVYYVQDINFDGIAQTNNQYYRYTPATGFVDGGSLSMSETFVTLRYVPANVQQGQIALREFSIYGAPGNLWFIGQWLNEFQVATTDAIYSGSRSISAGVSSATVTYSATFATTVAPVLGFHSASGAVAWSLTAQSSSAFTVAWTGTTAKILNMWNTRL